MTTTKNTLSQVLKLLGKEIFVPMVIGGAIGGWLSNEVIIYTLKRDLEKPRAEFVDKDERPDLVVGNRIYLAEPNGEYRRLNDTDIYRVR